MTVRNPGTSPIDGWTVGWSPAAGQTVNSIWNASRVGAGPGVSARNVDHNRTVAPGAQVTFGLNANSSGDNQPGSALSCSSP